MEDFFRQLDEIVKRFDISWDNVYNMDKKGVQLGGGRKGSNKRYIFSRHQKSRYRAKSNNLELMAVIDCVCATGNAEIPPGFVHQKGYAGEWWEIPGVGS